jgi:hypothetical protein
MKKTIIRGTEIIPDLSPELLSELREKIVNRYEIDISFDLMEGKIELSADDEKWDIRYSPGDVAFFSKSDDKIPVLVFLESFSEVYFYHRTNDLSVKPYVVIPCLSDELHELSDWIRIEFERHPVEQEEDVESEEEEV